MGLYKFGIEFGLRQEINDFIIPASGTALGTTATVLGAIRTEIGTSQTAFEYTDVIREQAAWGRVIETALYSCLWSVLVKVLVRASDGSDGYLGCTGGDAASLIRLLYDGSHYSNHEPEAAFTDVLPRRRLGRRSGQRAEAGDDSRGRGVQPARDRAPFVGSACSPPGEFPAGAPDQTTGPVQDRGRGAQPAESWPSAEHAPHTRCRQRSQPSRWAASSGSP